MIHIISELIKQYQTSNHRHDCQINMIQSMSISSGWFLATWTPIFFANRESPKVQTGNPQTMVTSPSDRIKLATRRPYEMTTSTVNIFPVFFPWKQLQSHQLHSFKGKFHILGRYVERRHAGWRNNVSLCEAWPSLKAWRMILQGHHLVLVLFDREVLRKLCPDGFLTKGLVGSTFRSCRRSILHHFTPYSAACEASTTPGASRIHHGNCDVVYKLLFSWRTRRLN